jgi:hypothetical protein
VFDEPFARIDLLLKPKLRTFLQNQPCQQIILGHKKDEYVKEGETHYILVNRGGYSRIIKVIEGKESQSPPLKKYTIKPNKKIHIIGLGDGGCNVLEYIFKQGFEAEYTCITSPTRSFPKEIQFIGFDPGITLSEFLQGSSKKNFNLPKDIKELFEPDNMYVLLAGLGSYTGTSFIKGLFKYLPTRKRDFMAICSYPFQFEGRRRKDFAESITIAFKETDNFIFFYMNSVIEKCGNVSLFEAFHRADVEVYRILKTIV